MASFAKVPPLSCSVAAPTAAQADLGDPAGHYDAAYWDSWFAKVSRGSAFEWYCSTSDLLPLLRAQFPESSTRYILHAGSGNSDMPFELAAHGFPRCLACDVSPVAIEEMQSKKAARMSEPPPSSPDVSLVEFAALDVLSSLPPSYSCSFDGVLDKGLFDAMMSDSSPSSLSRALTMFRNVGEAMKDGAVYVCVSLAEEHITRLLVGVAEGGGWELSVAPLSPEAATSTLRPFAFLLKKVGDNKEDKAKRRSFDELNAEICSAREEYAKRKTKSQPASPPRTLLFLDVKPYESECDLDSLLSRLKGPAPGSPLSSFSVLWKSSSVVPVGYGINKLSVTCVVESDMVEELCDAIMEAEEDEVQSVDVDW
eukprot:CAMPEP_0182472048 /NCGR_PEP_ID=MMETSP1319-20130603/21444_1 /TAXON_ID=172717 /ORGANISM="Bolidomonas pacifica, Strain RCC208" /LENGTH=367 /DNA_ID=CAMNT_0024672671 /DNA_START=60 /DNA_END=1160 /DNA_ORIENTATION=-